MDAVELIARTVFGEARGETHQGKVAVAWVIKNRVDNPSWWGTTVQEVCLNPFQFSCWNRRDPNHDTTLATPLDDERLAEIVQLCDGVSAGRIKDPTNGADSYCETPLRHQLAWAKHRSPTAVIGHHTFYKVRA